MTDRLVLGDGQLARSVASSLADQPGTVRVLTDDADLTDALREQGVSVSTGDPTDASSYANFSDVDVVITLAETGERNLAAARAVRDSFSEVYLIAYGGESECQDGRLDDLADKMVDPVDAIASALLRRAGDGGRQSRDLWTVLGGIDRLAIVTHDNPDPDAIASGVALARLAAAAGCTVDVCYFGEINHQENRAFVNVLDLDLHNLEDASEIDDYDGIALVDHSQPGVNDQLPEEVPVDIVIDHHPPHSPVDAAFVDLRSSAGATSTLLTEYLEQFGLLATETVTTALLFGIHIDTDGFTRGISEQDFTAAATLLSHADLGMIERIESPSIAPRTMETIADAIQNRAVEGEILFSCVGRLSDRDALAQAADRLLTLEDITTTVVYGYSEDTIYVSARARGTQIDLGETLREAFDQIGSAGGHVDMAGAQITLGVFEAVDDDDEVSLRQVVEEVVTNRFLDAVGPRVTDGIDGMYDPSATESYLESGTDAGPGGESTEPTASDGVLYTGHENDDQPSVADPRDGTTGDDGD